MSPTSPHRGYSSERSATSANLGRTLLWVATADERDVDRSGDRVLYLGIGIFLCLFALYGFAAYYVFLDRVGVRRLGSPLVGTTLTLAVAGFVTLAVVVFDRTLISHIDADLERLEPVVPNKTLDSSVFLHPLARRRLGPFLGRVVLAMVVGLFATQTIELFVFHKDIQSSREEQQLTAYRAELQSARTRQANDIRHFDRRQAELQNQIQVFNAESTAGRAGQHGACASRTICAESRDSSRALSITKRKLLAEDPSRIESSDSRQIRDLEQSVAELKDHPARVLGRNDSVLQDVTALYPYLRHHFVALLFYIAFTVLFFALDLGALLLKYTLAWNSEYERDRAAQKRERWLHRAETYRLRAQAGLPTPDEQAEAGRRATAVRRAMAGVDERAAEVGRQVVLSSYERMPQDSAVIEAADRHVRHDLIDHMAHPGRLSTAPNESEMITLGSRHRGVSHETEARESRLDGGFLLGVFGAVGALVAFVYLLGGAYMVAQLEQASLPPTTLTYVSSRTILQIGVIIAVLALALILGIAQVLRPLARWVAKTITGQIADADNIGQAIRSIWQLLTGFLKKSKRPVAPDLSVDAAKGGGAVLAATTAAGVAGELTDLGFAGGLEVFGGLAFAGLAAGLLILAVTGLLNARSRLSRSSMLFIVVALATAGAYQAGRLRPFGLPIAEVQLVGTTSCREIPLLGETADSVYFVDGTKKTLEVIPWRTIASFTLKSAKEPLADEASKTIACGTKSYEAKLRSATVRQRE